jgi:hypothetical protein
MKDERIPGVVEYSLTNERKALAGWTTYDNIDGLPSESGCLSDLRSSKGFNICAEYCAFREVDLVGSCVNRVPFHSRDDIKSGLLKPK